jgi:two-component system, NarL family, sensor histidine kinase DevS
VVEVRGSGPFGRDLSFELFWVTDVGSAEPGVALLTRDLTDTRRLAFLEERQRIAMDLHDGTVQSLYALILSLGAHERTLNDKDVSTSEALWEARRQIQSVIQETRNYIRSLRSESWGLDGPVLRLALEGLVDEVRRGGLVRAELELGPGADEPADPLVASSVLYVAREAVANAIRHAAASVVTIRLSRDPAGLTLSVRDDGQGFDPGGVRQGQGLRNMSERAKTFGGRLAVLSEPGRGTEVRLEILSSEERIGGWGGSHDSMHWASADTHRCHNRRALGPKRCE